MKAALRLLAGLTAMTTVICAVLGVVLLVLFCFERWPGQSLAALYVLGSIVVLSAGWRLDRNY